MERRMIYETSRWEKENEEEEEEEHQGEVRVVGVGGRWQERGIGGSRGGYRKRVGGREEAGAS
eukprot:4190176-Pyramimonas_sp.AAC.1